MGRVGATNIYSVTTMPNTMLCIFAEFLFWAFKKFTYQFSKLDVIHLSFVQESEMACLRPHAVVEVEFETRSAWLKAYISFTTL